MRSRRLTRDCWSSGKSLEFDWNSFESEGKSLVGAKSAKEKASQRWPGLGGSSRSNWTERMTSY